MRSLGFAFSLLLLLLPLVAMGQQKKAEDVARETFRRLQWKWEEPLTTSTMETGTLKVADRTQSSVAYLNADGSLKMASRWLDYPNLVPLHTILKDDASAIRAAKAEIQKLGLHAMDNVRVTWPARKPNTYTGFDNEVKVEFSDTPQDLKTSNPVGNVVDVNLDLGTGQISYLWVKLDWAYTSSMNLISKDQALSIVRDYLKDVGYRDVDLTPYQSYGPSYLSPMNGSIATANAVKYYGRREVRPGYAFTFGNHTHVEIDGATGEVLSAGLLKSGGKGPSPAAQAKLSAKVAERPNPLLLWVGGSAVILSTFAIWRRNTKRP